MARPAKVFWTTLLHPKGRFWRIRAEVGEAQFDHQLEALWKILNRMQPGQYFYADKLCKDKSNVWLVLYMAEVYFNANFLEELDIDYDSGKVTRLVPRDWHNDHPFPVQWPIHTFWRRCWEVAREHPEEFETANKTTEHTEYTDTANDAN